MALPPVGIHGDRVYKILSAPEWRRARAQGRFVGSALDLADGFMHLSTAAQVRDTLALHFAGRDDLVLLSVAVAACPQGSLRFEPSRGGALFPHLYAALDMAWVVAAVPLALAADGHRLPADLS